MENIQIKNTYQAGKRRKNRQDEDAFLLPRDELDGKGGAAFHDGCSWNLKVSELGVMKELEGEGGASFYDGCF